MLGFNPNDTGFDPKCDLVQDQVLRDAAIKLADYLPMAWKKTLEAVASATPQPPIDNGKKLAGALLTQGQYQAIVQRDLTFPLLDQEFEWMMEPEEDE